MGAMFLVGGALWEMESDAEFGIDMMETPLRSSLWEQSSSFAGPWDEAWFSQDSGNEIHEPCPHGPQGHCELGSSTFRRDHNLPSRSGTEAYPVQHK